VKTHENTSKTVDQNGFVMFVQLGNDFTGRIFRILQAPVLGRVLGINK
jgi:hypothetical protein